MQMLDVYQSYPIVLEKGNGLNLTDDKGNKYLDFYGGHGVIAIGHSHPDFVQAISKQLHKIAFYSNAFLNPLQDKLASLLGELSGYQDHKLFLSNSGAEANENALKLASMVSGRNKIIALQGAFHGRSAAAVAVTDNPKIRAPFGSQLPVDFIEMNDIKTLKTLLRTNNYAALIIEGIQGVNGVYEASTEFWEAARLLCTETGTLLIADEIQSGYGRSGKFFAHQYHNVKADMVTLAKGMGNGFPVAGTLIAPHIQINKGMLGTTFGGGHLACAAAISVLETFKKENLLNQAAVQGEYLKSELNKIEGITTIRGRGLMLGVEFTVPAKAVRQQLITEYGIITGFSDPETLRILPPLNITQAECRVFLESLAKVLSKLLKEQTRNQNIASNA
jgi:acetylornithine aminotransferase